LFIVAPLAAPPDAAHDSGNAACRVVLTGAAAFVQVGANSARQAPPVQADGTHLLHVIEDAVQRTRAARDARIVECESAMPHIHDQTGMSRVLGAREGATTTRPNSSASASSGSATAPRPPSRTKTCRLTTMASQFNGPGTTWPSVNLCRLMPEKEKKVSQSRTALA
jgi:hypothetical protein